MIEIEVDGKKYKFDIEAFKFQEKWIEEREQVLREYISSKRGPFVYDEKGCITGTRGGYGITGIDNEGT